MGKNLSCCISRRSRKVQPITIQCETKEQRDAAPNQGSIPKKESYTLMPGTMNNGGSMLFMRTDCKAHSVDGDLESGGIRPRNPSPPADSPCTLNLVDEVGPLREDLEATRERKRQSMRVEDEDILEVKLHLSVHCFTKVRTKIILNKIVKELT